MHRWEPFVAFIENRNFRQYYRVFLPTKSTEKSGGGRTLSQAEDEIRTELNLQMRGKGSFPSSVCNEEEPAPPYRSQKMNSRNSFPLSTKRDFPVKRKVSAES